MVLLEDWDRINNDVRLSEQGTKPTHVDILLAHELRISSWPRPEDVLFSASWAR